MCGIVGFAGSSFSQPQLREMVGAACKKLRHRGPDEEGDYYADGVALGISRLAIRDPVKGKQPMTRQGMTIVFNGELYDTQPLKSELQQKGYQFETDCDTEIFLLAFIEQGPSMLVDLTGMFAFALWDANQKTLYLGRDRWGEKPLYYTYGDDFLAFASEIKALRTFPNIRWDIALKDISLFLKNSYIPTPNTGWEKIFKLEKGSFLTWHQAKLSQKYYFYPSLVNVKAQGCHLEQAEELLSLLSSSVQTCLVSDKPVGAFLSGGIDSTTIAYLLARHHSNFPVFSVFWDDLEYSEEQYAKEASFALGLKLHSIKCDAQFFQNQLDHIVQLYDEPFADESMVPSYCLAKFAKQHVDVVLTGDGADEFFHGYERYFFEGSHLSYFDLFSAMNREVKEMICANVLIKYDDETHLHLLTNQFTEKNNPHSHRLRSWIDIQTYLTDDILTKVDRATMGVGLEARAPFLTTKVTNFALNCSDHELFRSQNRGKEILRSAMRPHLPDRIINRKKMGFGVPICKWFRTILKEWMVSRLTEGCLFSTNWFSDNGIRKLIDSHLSGQANHSRAILNLIVLETWLRNNQNHITNSPYAK
ncbi:MAG: asparagine synthase (glutamine-hydrolyzing) [Chlamydiales bacterium]